MNKYIRRSMAMAVALSIVGAQMNLSVPTL